MRRRGHSSSTRRMNRPSLSPTLARRTSRLRPNRRARSPRCRVRRGATGTNGRTPARVAASTAREKRASDRSRSPSSRYERPSAWSIVARYGLAGLSPFQRESGRHAASPPPRCDTAGRAGTPASPPSCSRRPASPSPMFARPRPPSARCRQGGRSRRASAPRARRSPESVRRGRWLRTTPSSASRCGPGRSPTPGWRAATRGGRPDLRRRRPGHGRWLPPSDRSPRTTSLPGGGAPGRWRARAAAAPTTAARGTVGDSGTTPGGGRAVPPTGCDSPTARGRCSIAVHRRPRRRADRTCGRGSTCGSGTAPPPATHGRGTRIAGSHP